MPIHLSKLQTPLLWLVKKAGQAILDIYEQHPNYSVTLKSDHSPLTQADLKAHQILVDGLSQLTPDLPILSEESIDIPWEERQKWTQYWLIDPLDGTRQFIDHQGEFTVNLALIQQGEPIIGILYVPTTQETYYASKAWKGAYKQDANGHVVLINTRLWKKDQTLVLTSRTAQAEKIKMLFERLGVYTQLKMSSAWKFAWLAEGKADISPRLGDTCEWDTAAGQCILELAGGALLDFQGKPLRYNTKSSLINPYFIALGDIGQLFPLLFDNDDRYDYRNRL